MGAAPIFLVRIVAVLCMAAVLGLGLQSARATVEDFHHRSHGDVATSDGGWIVADCHGDADHCTVIDDDGGSTSADGHHHHNGADAPGGVLPVAMEMGVWAPVSALIIPAPTPRLEDADLGRPGRVPRTSIRLA